MSTGANPSSRVVPSTSVPSAWVWVSVIWPRCGSPNRGRWAGSWCLLLASVADVGWQALCACRRPDRWRLASQGGSAGGQGNERACERRRRPGEHPFTWERTVWHQAPSHRPLLSNAPVEAAARPAHPEAQALARRAVPARPRTEAQQREKAHLPRRLLFAGPLGSLRAAAWSPLVAEHIDADSPGNGLDGAIG